jgi:hypothetical protein
VNQPRAKASKRMMAVAVMNSWRFMGPWSVRCP